MTVVRLMDEVSTGEMVAFTVIAAVAAWLLYQLTNNLGHSGPPVDGREGAAAMALARATVDLGTELVGASNRSRAFFSWSCYDHNVALTESGFRQEQADGVTMEVALATFMRSRQKGEMRSMEWVDRCAGFACGAGCADGWARARQEFPSPRDMAANANETNAAAKASRR